MQAGVRRTLVATVATLSTVAVLAATAPSASSATDTRDTVLIGIDFRVQDGLLVYGAGDAGGVSNNPDGSTATTLFDLDPTPDQVVIQ
ncbi:hypothetical protein [Streptomyces sp. B6B3]|uniref:hypothetical protein n=1 Tax=Streptomyces sp. B6B3 TaxID=3153570 RepID=UPI00325DB201